MKRSAPIWSRRGVMLVAALTLTFSAAVPGCSPSLKRRGCSPSDLLEEAELRNAAARSSVIAVGHKPSTPPNPVVRPRVEWDSIPYGGPAPVDIVGADNVIRAADGRDVVLRLSAGARVFQLQRVRGGWVIGYSDDGQRWGFVSDDGDVRDIRGKTGPGMLGVSPDGTLIAVHSDARRVDIYDLPTLTTVATLSVRAHQDAGRISDAYFVGADTVFIQSSRMGDGDGPSRIIVGWNWRTGETIALEDVGVVTAFSTMAVIDAIGAGSVGQLMRVDDSLDLHALGCLPPGQWWLSPDETHLAGFCPYRTCLAVLSMRELLAGMPALVRTVPLPVPATSLAWADNRYLLVSVSLLEEPGRPWEWGLLRCDSVTVACARQSLRSGPTAAAIDVGDVHG